MPVYDMAVLGGGPGGYVAAIRAARLGRKTVLIEKSQLGGTCLNQGCIPTKSLLAGAHLYREMREAAAFGILARDVAFDYAQMARRKDSVVKRLRGGVEQLLQSAGVEVVPGEGFPAGPRAVRVGDRVLEARNIILATGSQPAKLPIPGADLPWVTDSTGILGLEHCPASLVIVGGGVIGVEFASLFSALGVPVTILEAMDAILGGMDRDVVNTIHPLLEKSGITIRTGAKVTRFLEQPAGAVEYQWQDNLHQVETELVLVATGRRPVTELAAAWGIQTGRSGIMVDEYMRTNMDGIYAIGDCTGKLQLAHVASAQGLVAAGHAAGVPTQPMDYSAVPACVYTEPEIAAVGLTQQAAEAAGRKIRCGTFPVAANGKSTVMGCRDGFCKLVTDAGTGEILGAHIVAPRATDLIGEIAAVMRCEGTVEELAATIHPHPTISEIILESAHDIHHLSCHKP